MPSTSSNRLINALSSSVRAELLEKLEAVSLPIRMTLFDPGVPPEFAYFLTSGIASVVAEMENGGSVEVSLLGRESLPGSLLLLGGQPISTHCFMQIGGSGLRIAFQELMQVFRSNPELHARILQHAQYEAFTISQISACNRLHDVEERLARWILMLADRLANDELPITQEFLGEMLG